MKKGLIVVRLILCFLSGGIATASLANPHEIPMQVFISSSMPHEALKQLFHESRVIPVHFVIRGLINNSIHDTQRFLMGFPEEEQPSILIDPIAFERYKIKNVPAFVEVQSTCSDTKMEQGQCPYEKIAGMMGLQGASELLNKRDVG